MPTDISRLRAGSLHTLCAQHARDGSRSDDRKGTSVQEARGGGQKQTQYPEFAPGAAVT